MSTTLYIRAGEPTAGRRLIDELLGQGFEPGQLHAYGKQLPGGLPVEGTHWRNAFMAFLPGAVVGAVALPFLWPVLFKTPGTVEVLLLAGIGAVIAGGWSLLHERRKASPMNAQRQAMRRGELMVAADVDEDRRADVEQRIRQEHPEMDLLGSDPAGNARSG